MPLVSVTSREISGLYGIEGPEDVTIEGIVYDPNGSVVVINGSVLREGESSGNLKVLKIEKNGARFLISGTEAYIPLYREDPGGKKNP